MALRIGAGATPNVTKVPVAEDVVPTTDQVVPAPGDSDYIPTPLEENKANPAAANYRTPDMGPFMCGNCEYFLTGENACRIVAGLIHEDGMCNLFTPVAIAGVPFEPVDLETTPQFNVEGELSAPVPEDLVE